MKKSQEAARVIVKGVITTLSVFCAIGSIIEFKYILSPAWIPLAVASLVTLLLYSPLQRFTKWITDSSKNWANAMIYIILAYPLTIAGILAVNSIFSLSAETPERVFVSRVYKEKRYKSRRVSRRVHVRGAPYYAYCIKIEFDNGDTRTIDINKSFYKQVRKGDFLTVYKRTGIMGITTFEPNRICQNSNGLIPKDSLNYSREP